MKSPSAAIVVLTILSFALLVGCGEEDPGTDANDGDDVNQNDDNNGDLPPAPESLQERCEAACDRVYNECDERFYEFGDDGGVISEPACVDGCVDDNKFRGGEWCVATIAECSSEPRDMVDACLPDDYHPAACDELGAWRHDHVEFEEELLELVNDYRTEGTECDGEQRPAVDEVQWDAELRCAARLYSHTWVEGDEDEHNGALLTDAQAEQWAVEAGYGGALTGHDVHHGHRDAIGLVEHWMEGRSDDEQQDPQCSMVMDEDADVIGFGRYDQERSTVMFGTSE